MALLLFTLAPFDAAAQLRNLNFTLHNFTTKIDHFSYSNNGTFQMRFAIADQYWDERKGPIFFYTGNEMRIESFIYSTGIMWEWAIRFQALLVFAEHRYYGESLPFGNDSFKASGAELYTWLNDLEHMAYLSSEQAMADYAHLLVWIMENIGGGKPRPVVAFGGSYGAMLAAWMRVKYPYFVTAKVVSRTWPVLDKLGSTPDGCKTLQKKFGTCQALAPGNYTEFRDWIRDAYSILAMINYPFATTFLGPIPAHPVKKACDVLSRGQRSEEGTVDAVASVTNMIYNGTGKSSCIDIQRAANMQAYRFQECTELIRPTCTDGVNDMFYPQEWSPEKFAERCRERFGVATDFSRIAMNLPTLDFGSASNIFFTYVA
ncbi:hypothetical protein HPB50_015468 [Hyalomma asiaticum]|uniref:Uncharacterized protein n=1 Tax=Hyalomma asiaticum TaxID=266040 RepID=A0ACB7T557_HYAAI|nr:hypothetical protein HPB50_015468 [Hyalomma asiaticum]